MDFNLPTTQAQMHEVLVELFNHYRVRKQGYEEIVLQELSLPRLEMKVESDADLMDRAENLLKADHVREITKYQNELTSKLTGLQEKVELLEKSHAEEIENVTNLYNQSIEKVQNQVVKAGLINSTIVVDKTALLEDSKNQKIADLTGAKNEKVASLLAEIEQINGLLSTSEEYFSAIHQNEIDKKFIELCAEREKNKIEIFKYNNGLDEKEQRVANSIKQTASSLHLRFLEIKAAEYTKDQLVEMGYFKDVIACVSAYYDTLEPLTAYQNFLANKELMTYLDFYYEQVALYYKLRAGL